MSVWVGVRGPAGILTVVAVTGGCVLGEWLGLGREPDKRGPPVVVPADSIRETAITPPADMDSLSAALNARADTSAVSTLPSLEEEIRDWLARLEFEDPELLPLGGDPDRFYRFNRGRLLDALGWAAFRRGDARQAEAALETAVTEINSRGTTTGYARHFLHLGQVRADRGRWEVAVEAFLAAEVRGLGGEATPSLEAAYRRRNRSLTGLDDLRARERERVEDERRQALVTGSSYDSLPAVSYPRRTGPPLAIRSLVGKPLVIAIWDGACRGCAGYAGRLEPLATAMRQREGNVLGLWLGGDPSGAGPPRRFTILVGASQQRVRFGVDSLPALLVVDGAGRIRFRHGGPQAIEPPWEDVLIQVDFLFQRQGDR